MSRSFVFDTNVLLNALLMPRSSSNIAVSKALRRDVVLYSEATLQELEEKIYLERFNKYISLNRRLEFFHRFKFDAFPVLIDVKIEACRDPKDDKFLELAVSGNVDCIISKDKDLLVLHPFEDIKILNVPEFLNIFYPPY